MTDWSEYAAEHRVPAIIAPSGNLANHHYNEDGTIGARVTDETATHAIVTTTRVLPA